VVIMLHGNPTWSFFYRHLIESLRKSFRVIVPDHIGCGLSDKPRSYNYSLATHIDNITTLIDSLGISTFSMVVHDWGGAIGFGYATRYQDRLDKIVVLNTAAFRSERIPLRIRLCRLPLLGPFIVRGCNGFAWPATFMAVSKPLKKEDARAYIAPYNNWHNRIAVSEFVQDIPLSPKDKSYRTLIAIEEKLHELRENKIEILIVWGGKDFCFNDTFYEEWKARFPEARTHYLKNAGHYVLEDGHGVVEPLIDDFFKG